MELRADVDHVGGALEVFTVDGARHLAGGLVEVTVGFDALQIGLVARQLGPRLAVQPVAQGAVLVRARALASTVLWVARAIRKFTFQSAWAAMASDG